MMGVMKHIATVMLWNRHLSGNDPETAAMRLFVRLLKIDEMQPRKQVNLSIFAPWEDEKPGRPLDEQVISG
jgi:hypothetical protein